MAWKGGVLVFLVLLPHVAASFAITVSDISLQLFSFARSALQQWHS